MPNLATIYATSRGDAARIDGMDRASLELLLRQLFDDGRAAWPEIALSAEAFVVDLAHRSAELPDGARAADLYLACACTAQVPAALAAFDAQYLSKVPAYLSRLNAKAHAIDEVQQLLRQRVLLGGPRHAPHIAQYSGRGTLASWIRAAAIRLALNVVRAEGRHRHAIHAAAADAPLESPDPELELLKAQHGELFEEAFRGALETLSARDRTLLRMRYQKGVAVGAVAASYGVDRTTVSRWLRSAQTILLEETRRLLRERLRLTQSECESLMGRVQSRLDVTLTSLLRTPAPK